MPEASPGAGHSPGPGGDQDMPAPAGDWTRDSGLVSPPQHTDTHAQVHTAWDLQP